MTAGQIKSGNSRVWIANKAILKSCSIGDSIIIRYNKGRREVTIEPTGILGNHTVSSRSGKDPIIDIKNKNITDLYSPGDKIEVCYFKNKIIIRVAAVQNHRERRHKKRGRRLFDLFSGAGTLSALFKKAGFDPVGALELSEQYISLYTDNHGDDVYTIAAKIEDVMPEDYPEDIDTVLVGLPCTVYSEGNVSMLAELSKMRTGEISPPIWISVPK